MYVWECPRAILEGFLFTVPVHNTTQHRQGEKRDSLLVRVTNCCGCVVPASRWLVFCVLKWKSHWYQRSGFSFTLKRPVSICKGVMADVATVTVWCIKNKSCVDR